MPAAKEQAPAPVVCPQCAAELTVSDAFCPQCGGNLRRKKLRIKEAPAAPPPEPLPIARFSASRRPVRSRLSLWERGLVGWFLLAVSGAVLVGGVYWFRTRASAEDWLSSFRQPRVAAERLSSFWQKLHEPDWQARYQFWFAYYRAGFVPPETNIWWELGLISGARHSGILMQIQADQLLLRQAAHELWVPRLLLDNTTRQVFFADDFAAARAQEALQMEQAAWRARVAGDRN